MNTLRDSTMQLREKSHKKQLRYYLVPTYYIMTYETQSSSTMYSGWTNNNDCIILKVRLRDKIRLNLNNFLMALLEHSEQKVSRI